MNRAIGLAVLASIVMSALGCGTAKLSRVSCYSCAERLVGLLENGCYKEADDFIRKMWGERPSAFGTAVLVIGSSPYSLDVEKRAMAFAYGAKPSLSDDEREMMAKWLLNDAVAHAALFALWPKHRVELTGELRSAFWFRIRRFVVEGAATDEQERDWMRSMAFYIVTCRVLEEMAEDNVIGDVPEYIAILERVEMGDYRFPEEVRRGCVKSLTKLTGIKPAEGVSMNASEVEDFCEKCRAWFEGQ
jgi:hypothetical protein